MDQHFADDHPEINFRRKFILAKSGRKPTTDMITNALQEIQINISNFDKILVLGDRKEDHDLAKNLHANFINIKGESYPQLLQEFH